MTDTEPSPPRPSDSGGLLTQLGQTLGFKSRELKVLKPTGANESRITVIPPLKDPDLVELELRKIDEPYTYVRISYNKKTHEKLYSVIEPRLNPHQRDLLLFVEDTLRRTLRYDFEKLRHQDQVSKYLRSEVTRIKLEHALHMHKVDFERIMYYIERDFAGLGLIQPLMNDPMLEDISCDGPQIPIFVYDREHESLRTNVFFTDDNQLDAFVIQLAQKCGKHISISNPLLDATLPEGSRLQATLAKEVTTRGSSFTIRKFREDPLTPPDLVNNNSISVELAGYLWLAVEHGSSIMFCGGTASGKTTLLNATALFIPPQMKVVTIEETREINLPHENWIAGLTRSGFGGGKGPDAPGAIDLYELMTAALRQRPQYLIVGEVRGKETYTLFQAMATGHTTFSTMHAESVSAMVHRLENPPIELPRLLLEALDLVVIQNLVRMGDLTVRRVTEVIEIVRIDARTNDLVTNRVFKWDPGTDTYSFNRSSEVLKELQQRKSWTEAKVTEELDNRIKLVNMMREKGLRTFRDVGQIVAGYYSNPEDLIKEVL